MKTCRRCTKEKPLDVFARDRSRRDGRGSCCKPCNVERVQERRRSRGPENQSSAARERKAERERARKAEDPEYWEKRRGQQKAWYARNPEYKRDLAQQRRARIQGVDRERIYRAQVWLRDAGICGICGTLADVDEWHLDHIIPLAAGGAHVYINVQVSHPSCNLMKGKTVSC